MQTSKKTYNLTAVTIRLVQEMARQGTYATTQDAVVERAVAELARQARDRQHAALWSGASTDPGFQAEVAEVGHEFEADDRAAWELE